jgi:hypothetical protein
VQDAINYQRDRITADSGWEVVARNVCNDPAESGATATSVTLNCPASGTQAIIISNSQRDALKGRIAGRSVEEANQILRAETGVTNATIQLANDGTFLPSDPAKITLNVTP